MKYFDEFKIDGFDFSNGFKCSDVQIFEKSNVLSVKPFELSFYQERKEWKHKLISIETSNNASDRVVDILI